MARPSNNPAHDKALLLNALVDCSEDAIISKDLNGIITTWNQAAERLFGYTAREAIGRPITILIPPERLDEEPRILARIRAGERVDHFETVRMRKDGTSLGISLTISPIRDSAGVIIGASKIARDLTRANSAEQSHRLLSAIVDSSDDAIISKDLDGVITSWNRAAERLFGYTAREAVGRPITILIPPERLDEEPGILARLRAGQRVDHFETVRMHKSGYRFDVSLTISPVKDSAGLIVGASKIARDISERKRIDAEIRRANQDLEQFAFSASHDLQEPLRNVMIYSELLGRKLEGQLDQEAQFFLNYVHSGAARMETLLRDLLAYARVSRVEPEFVLSAAGEALDAALETLADRSAMASAVHTRDPLPRVAMNSSHLQQIFQNLIGNALKYRGAAPPQIHIGATLSAKGCTFLVRDNGIGIDPGYSEVIFELFRRLHTDREYTGTGIGLAICQRIVERYNGRIWVESQLGQGSTFYFTVPYEPPIQHHPRPGFTSKPHLESSSGNLSSTS